jgi:hypothetical protein
LAQSLNSETLRRQFRGSVPFQERNEPRISEKKRMLHEEVEMYRTGRIVQRQSVRGCIKLVPFIHLYMPYIQYTAKEFLTNVMKNTVSLKFKIIIFNLPRSRDLNRPES